MLKRLLLAVALPVLAAAPVHAQTTIFRATGGDVIFTPSGFNVGQPFELFLEAVGAQSRRLVFSGDGTSVTLDTKGTVGNTGFHSLGSLDLGSFSAGTGLAWDLVVGGVTYSNLSFYRAIAGGFSAEYVSGTQTVAPGEQNLFFQLTGVKSIENFHCTIPEAPPLIVCPADIPAGDHTNVTATPEPASMALFATGLAGLIPVAIRRRRKAVSPSSP